VGVFTFPSFEFRVTLGRNTVSVFPFRGFIGSVLNGSATDPADRLNLSGNLAPVIFGLRGFDEAGTLLDSDAWPTDFATTFMAAPSRRFDVVDEDARFAEQRLASVRLNALSRRKRRLRFRNQELCSFSAPASRALACDAGG
jgi:hypothetical protein